MTGCLSRLQKDLLAEFFSLEARFFLTGGAARVDPPHEILANELCTLRSRSELREFIADLKDRLARAAFPGPRA